MPQGRKSIAHTVDGLGLGFIGKDVGYREGRWSTGRAPEVPSKPAACFHERGLRYKSREISITKASVLVVKTQIQFYWFAIFLTENTIEN